MSPTPTLVDADVLHAPCGCQGIEKTRHNNRDPLIWLQILNGCAGHPERLLPGVIERWRLSELKTPAGLTAMFLTAVNQGAVTWTEDIGWTKTADTIEWPHAMRPVLDQAREEGLIQVRKNGTAVLTAAGKQHLRGKPPQPQPTA